MWKSEEACENEYLCGMKLNQKAYDNIGKLCLDLGKLTFGSLVLGSILKGDIDKAYIIIGGSIVALILIVAGIFLTSK
ncbi:MAG: hypothetical protein LBO71_00190 [Prevotellaceae bacterium]|jgi:hypothetical protein|nr:hypothetical protein [Prevotellaceae bacterium]